MIDTAYRIENLCSDMSTDEIRNAMEQIRDAIAILQEAVDNRLEELDEEQAADDPEVYELQEYRAALEGCWML